MPRHLIDGVRAVRRDLDQVFLPDVLAVGLPVHNAVHELDPHAQLLADGIQRRCRALVFGDDVPAVGIVRQPGSRRGSHCGHVRIFPCHLRSCVLQPRVVRRVPLLRRQHRRVLALGLFRLNAVQPRVVHSGKACVHFRAAAACLPHLLIRSLTRLHKAAHGFLCAFLRLGDSRGALRLLLRCLAACKGDNFTFELADGLFRVQLYPGAGLQRLHGHRVPCNGRRLVAGDRLAPGHRLHGFRRPAVHLRRGVLPHVPVILRSGRVVCRAVGKGVHAHLPAAQNTANYSAAGKFFRRCRRVENGAVADTDKGVAPSIDGVLRGAFDHALHHFLLALVQHGVHPCFPCAAAVLQFPGQRLDTAAHFHGGVHKSVADGVHGSPEVVRAVRFCLLIAGAKYLCKGELEVRIFHHCPHTAGNGVDQPGGSRRVFRQCACLCRRAGAAGQQRRNGLRHRRHRRRTQVFENLRRFPAACRVFRVPLLHALRLRVNSPVPAVEKPVAGVRVPVAVGTLPGKITQQVLYPCAGRAAHFGDLCQAHLSGLCQPLPNVIFPRRTCCVPRRYARRNQHRRVRLIGAGRYIRRRSAAGADNVAAHAGSFHFAAELILPPTAVCIVVCPACCGDVVFHPRSFHFLLKCLLPAHRALLISPGSSRRIPDRCTASL